jgi:hypothetical protein
MKEGGSERTVIGTRRLSCVASFEGRFVVEHEAMMKTRDLDKKKDDQHRHVTAGGPTCPVPSMARTHTYRRILYSKTENRKLRRRKD